MDSNPRGASVQLPLLDPRSGKGNCNTSSVVASGGRTKATVHICQICEQRFGTLYNLKVHIRKQFGVDLNDSEVQDLLKGSTFVGKDVGAASGRMANEPRGMQSHGDVPEPRAKDIEVAKNDTHTEKAARVGNGCNAADKDNWVASLVGEPEEGRTSDQTSTNSPDGVGSGCEEGVDAEDASKSPDCVISRWASVLDDTTAADSLLKAFPAELAVFQPSFFGETQISTDYEIFTDCGPEQPPEFFDPLF